MSKPQSPPGAADAADAGRILDQPESLIVTVRSSIACMLRRGLLDPDVQDCTQEVLRRAVEGRERLAKGRPIRPWVLGIARHVVSDWRRQQQRATHCASENGEGSTPWHQIPSSEPATDERLAHAELLGTLDRLPVPQRRALLLFHVEGLSYREIALRLSVPVGTVGTWIIRGREQLSSRLREESASHG